MFIALDENKKRVNAYTSKRNKTYFCPICNQEVIPKQGQLVSWHFAHVTKPCSDKWYNDMSEWHKSMQERFSEEYREIVIDERHRADIIIGGIVIEFQHSSISVGEFDERNDFYNSFGFPVVWIIDIDKQIRSRQVLLNPDTGEIHWKNPYKFLRNTKLPQEYNEDIAICIADCERHIYKINYSSIDGFCTPNYKNIRIDLNKEIILSDNMDVNEFFQ